VVPMDDINLHFTGDMHAIGAAHNLLSAMVDNHLYWQKTPVLDARRVRWRRVVDMNDRALRSVNVGLGGPSNGYPREDGYDITVASEVMAVLCLATDVDDLTRRLGNIVVGETRGRELIRARDLKADGAMTALLLDAFNPNLVQTLEQNAALIHGGPFANIAHGCNSAVATKLGLQLADYVVTEAGFGADLGAEKFLNIKCRKAGLDPAACVLVATVRALKLHGGESDLKTPSVGAVEKGGVNMQRHIENMGKFGLPVVVCVNRFPTDTDEEIAAVRSMAEAYGARCVVGDHWARGGAGCEDLASAVVSAVESGKAAFQPLYSDELSIEEKLHTIATQVYRADGVRFADEAKTKLKGLGDAAKFPVCVAKTQYSFSDDPKLAGAPSGHMLTVRDLRVCYGAEFVVALTGSIMTMPGLPKAPASEVIHVDGGVIRGLF